MKGVVSRHIHLRTRKARSTSPYPSQSMWLRLLDKCAVLAGILGPLMTLPQIWQIYHFHNAAGVSAVSWIAFGILDFPFVLYGVAHRDRLIFVTYLLWCAVNLTVAVGAVIYQ